MLDVLKSRAEQNRANLIIGLDQLTTQDPLFLKAELDGDRPTEHQGLSSSDAAGNLRGLIYSAMTARSSSLNPSEERDHERDT
jgi:hypothetical protein